MIGTSQDEVRVSYGPSHCILHTEQLSKEGDAGSAVATRESDPVLPAVKEISLALHWIFQ
jgi:hypothetical protein